MTGGARVDLPATTALAGLAAVLATYVAISVSGIRPPGESEMLKQIELEDSYLCEKFGMQRGTPSFWDCMSELADLRKRHMAMMAAYDLP